MEPENHPFAKENHLPNDSKLLFLRSMLICQGVNNHFNPKNSDSSASVDFFAAVVLP